MSAETKDAPREVTQRRSTIVVHDRTQPLLQRCKLVQVTGSDQGKAYELTKEETLVGSAPDCDLRIIDRTVSRRHFVVVHKDQDYLIRDLGSTNGTYLDNAQVNEAFIRPGALLRVGEIYLRFELVHERIDVVPSEARHFGALLGESIAMREIFGVLEKVAATETTVLLQGETGTGKGVVARAIHQASGRRDNPFVVFDCGAVAPTLVESELFGHERGAFTGATQQRKGALDQAQSGTLFLDELSDLPLDLQPKLLRALEDREFTRVGRDKPTHLDCRVIAASQHDLWEEVDAGRFREDLYFRLAVVTVPLPPLRERREDIPMLVDRFLQARGVAGCDRFDSLDADVQRELLAHDWPGNIRELRNTIERAVLMNGAVPFLGAKGSKHAKSGAQPDDRTAVAAVAAVNYDVPFKVAKDELIRRFERQYLVRLLERTENNIARAAREAEIDRKHLYTLLSKHGLDTSHKD